ncbi:ATP-binding protein [Brevibacillus sp. MER 51]|uniref:two-component system sensor histidine kinase NtrB n=1 Tax=Brevibacillus sp. MER 51 TaxID=2939560 RepID=UPI00203B6337|nr:ATP-binding protein [Brevibacillus sp. MER 51]MCM3141154.1 ATP-binding protein [Brevibacillus sp. MER 51]
MKNRISKYLTHLVPAAVAKTFSFLSDHHYSALLLEDRENTEALFVQQITKWIEVVKVVDTYAFEREWSEIAYKFSLLGMNLTYLQQFLRKCRDVIIEEMNNNSFSLATTEMERVELLQAQIRLYQSMDCILYQMDDVFNKNSHPFPVEKTPTSPTSSAKGEDVSMLAEQELVQLVLQSSDIAVLMIDRQLRVIEANYAFCHLFGVDRHQLIGKNIDHALSPHVSERFVQWVIERGQSGHYVAEYRGKWTTVSTSPIYYGEEMWGAIAVLRNVTESQKYEEELSKREALAAVGQLAAGMAHEIRNPLTAIKGFIQLLREQGEANRSESYFSVILTEIERIDGLLNDVLVLARYRDDKIVSERFLVMDELYGVIRLLEPEANRRGIKLELDIAQGEWHVFGHRSRIKQAILNILKNALEALMTQGNLVHVKVYSSLNQVIIVVEDNGPGLSDSCLQNLFVPFYTTKQEGTGLGLSTTQRIIADHGGELYAENSPKLKGARFEIRLPLSTS